MQLLQTTKNRMGKNLWSDKGEGEKIRAFTAFNEKGEGQFIASEITKQHKAGKKYCDCAVLYRANAQSRAIETALRESNIPYKILSGLRFYDRKEIKDILAYLRLVNNPNDDLSLVRVINEPKRKIGAASIGKLNLIALEKDMSMFDVAMNASDYPELKSAAARIESFTKIILNIRDTMEDMKISEIVNAIQSTSGYRNALMLDDTPENRSRLENLDEFMTVVKDYEEDTENDPDLEPSLAGFLENITLSAAVDDLEENEDAVILMTIHSAKGLEFPVVFLAGMEERLFPGNRSIVDPELLDEERRLCYVAMTRAKEQLYITKTEQRFMYGKTETSKPSRFWNEIPKELIEDVSPKKQSIFEYVTDRPKRNGLYENFMHTRKPKPKTSVAASSGQLVPGTRVKHKIFGEGTIIKAEGNKSATVLQISFDTAGVKTLLAEYAKLEII